MDFEKSETKKNLLKAFQKETFARCKYNLYAMIAKMEGFDYVSKVFDETSNNEKEHAKIWFKWFNEGSFPHTAENLKDAIAGETVEADIMYKNFAQIAKEEGFEHLSELFERVAEIEQNHKKRFEKLLLTVENNAKSDENGEYKWECSICGCVITQKDIPNYCPFCHNEDIFFFKK